LNNINGFKARRYVAVENDTVTNKKRIALEGAADFLRNIWEGIKRAVSYMWEKIKSFFGRGRSEEDKTMQQLGESVRRLRSNEKVYEEVREKARVSVGTHKLQIKESLISHLAAINKDRVDIQKDEEAIKIAVDSEFREIDEVAIEILTDPAGAEPPAKSKNHKEIWSRYFSDKCAEAEVYKGRIQDCKGRIALARDNAADSTRNILPTNIPLAEVVEKAISLMDYVTSIKGSLLEEHGRVKALKVTLQDKLAARTGPKFSYSDEQIVELAKGGKIRLDFTEKTLRELFRIEDLESFGVELAAKFSTEEAFAKNAFSDCQTVWELTDALRGSFKIEKSQKPDQKKGRVSDWILSPGRAEELLKLESKFKNSLEKFNDVNETIQAELKDELSKPRTWGEADKLRAFLLDILSFEHRKAHPDFYEGADADEISELKKIGRGRGWLFQGVVNKETFYIVRLLDLYKAVDYSCWDLRKVLELNSELIGHQAKLVDVSADLRKASLELNPYPT
jgi:hypothetical protein